jgi:hypothetical protein
MPYDAAVAGGAAPSGEARRTRRSRTLVLSVALGLLGPLVALGLMLSSKDCSRTEGELVASGPPLGDFRFVPAQCRSGERMSFFGVVLVGKGPADGGILVGEDAVKGHFVKIEIPGSCKPPGYEICTERFVEPRDCGVFEAVARKTGVELNDRAVFEGRLKLDCRFPEGGTAKASITFGRCY